MKLKTSLRLLIEKVIKRINFSLTYFGMHKDICMLRNAVINTVNIIFRSVCFRRKRRFPGRRKLDLIVIILQNVRAKSKRNRANSIKTF